MLVVTQDYDGSKGKGPSGQAEEHDGSPELRTPGRLEGGGESKYQARDVWEVYGGGQAVSSSASEAVKIHPCCGGGGVLPESVCPVASPGIEVLLMEGMCGAVYTVQIAIEGGGEELAPERRGGRGLSTVGLKNLGTGVRRGAAKRGCS